jgi:hypothetical protein
VRTALVALAAAAVLLQAAHAASAQSSGLAVTLESPRASLAMGDTPAFRGTVKNTGASSHDGLVVFLTIINLAPGSEAPIGLEDWSANPSVRIEHLAPGATDTQNWTMRLVQAGSYAATLTVIDHGGHPISSAMVPFQVASRPTLQSARILPIAMGEPVLLGLAVAGLMLWRSKAR